MKTPQIIVCIAVLSIVLGVTRQVRAADGITAESPASAIDMEGDVTVPAGSGPARFQFLYPAEDFTALPSTHRSITEFAWRPDATSISITDPVTAPVRFRLSSTPISDLGVTFADNRGPDDGPVVFDGIVTFQTDNQPAGPGPRNYDYSFEFQQPFIYDPSQGNNLLLEFEMFSDASQVRNWFIDGISTPGRVFGLSASSLDATEGRLRDSTWPAQFTFQVSGDFDDNGSLEVDDTNALMAEILAGTNDPAFNLDEDPAVNVADLTVWIHELKETWVGDADLDGEFNSTDLVAVFQVGQYEDTIDGNSGWAEGDWNADGDFTTSDLTAAFQDGGYDQGPRVAVLAVPEPSFGILVVTASIFGAVLRSPRRRTRDSNSRKTTREV